LPIPDDAPERVDVHRFPYEKQHITELSREFFPLNRHDP